MQIIYNTKTAMLQKVGKKKEMQKQVGKAVMRFSFRARGQWCDTNIAHIKAVLLMNLFQQLVDPCNTNTAEKRGRINVIHSLQSKGSKA